MCYNWSINLVASSTLTSTFSWHCWEISCFCRGSRERPAEKFASSFCMFTKDVFTLLTFSSFTMFIFLRLVVNGFALFLTLKVLGWLYGIHSWTSALLVFSWPLSGLRHPPIASQVPGDTICTHKIQAIFFSPLCSLQDLSSLTRDWTWATAVKTLNPDYGTTRECPKKFLSHMRFLYKKWRL